jgi:hypothetical protein
VDDHIYVSAVLSSEGERSAPGEKEAERAVERNLCD